VRLPWADGKKKKRNSKYSKAARKRRQARRRRKYESALPGVLQRERLALPPIQRPAIGEMGQDVRERVRHGAGRLVGSGWHWSKLFSGLLLIAALAGVYWVNTEATYFIAPEGVTFRQLGYLNTEELYPLTDIEDWSVFWLQPEVIRERVLTHPYVTDARVKIGLPATVEITVEEVQPIALWVTRDATLWLMEDGSALTMRTAADQPSADAAFDAEGRPLPQIVDVNREAQTPGLSAIDREVLRSGLTLLAQFPGLDSVRFNEGYGLNFGLPGTDHWVYWGDGYDLDTKMENLVAGERLIASGQANGQIIDVRYLERPFIR